MLVFMQFFQLRHYFNNPNGCLQLVEHGNHGIAYYLI